MQKSPSRLERNALIAASRQVEAMSRKIDSLRRQTADPRVRQMLDEILVAGLDARDTTLAGL